jgi:uncharacterized protein (DUF58 family)
MMPCSPSPHPPEIHYRALQPAQGHFPGAHRSQRGQTGFEFRGHTSLLDAPDVRRLDLHASLRDPFGQWRVRVFKQRKSMPVLVLADLSASMGFQTLGSQTLGFQKLVSGTPALRKLDVLADFCDCLARSAWRSGDSFGFMGCDQQVRHDVLLPPTRARGAGVGLAQTLRALALTGTSAQGLLQAAPLLGRQRALVFLVSDFHWPLALVKQVFNSLNAHQVVPVVLWNPAEFKLSARHGFVQVQDPETGQKNWLWWRPALREQWLLRQAQSRQALQRVLQQHALKPLFMADRFDADAVTRHFLA